MRSVLILIMIGTIFISILIGVVSTGKAADDHVQETTPVPTSTVPVTSISAGELSTITTGFDFVAAEPRVGAQNLETLSSGEPVAVLGINESLDWYYIRTRNFLHGWIKAQTILLNEAEIRQLSVLPAPEAGSFSGRRNVVLDCGRVELAYTNAPVYLLWRVGAENRNEIERIADSLALTVRVNDLEIPGAPAYLDYRLPPERYSESPERYGVTWRFSLGVLSPGTYEIFHEYKLDAATASTVEIGYTGRQQSPEGNSTCQIVVNPPEGFNIAAVPTEQIVMDENLFVETFDDNHRDWQPAFFRGGEGSMTVENGVLQMEISGLPAMQSDIFLHTALPEDERYVDFAATVDVTSVSDKGFHTAELWFRATRDASRGYVFRLDPNGQRYSLGLREGNVWLDNLIEDTFSEAIKPDETNQLGVVVIGNQIDLYINGVLVDSVKNSDIVGGTIMLSVTAYADGVLPAAVQFDNLRISDDIALIFPEVALALTTTPRPTNTPTPTITPIPTNTFTYTPTATFTFTPLPTDTPSPTATSTNTPSYTPTGTATSTPTATPTNTATFTPTATPTSTFTPTATFTPTFTSTPTFTPTPVVIPNVAVSPGGIEVYPLPDRASGRLFAAFNTDFAPYAAGRTADSQWVYLYYFEGAELQDGWALARHLQLTRDQITRLSIINPQNVPPFPDVPFSEAAQRPGR